MNNDKCYYCMRLLLVRVIGENSLYSRDFDDTRCRVRKKKPKNPTEKTYVFVPIEKVFPQKLNC